MDTKRKFLVDVDDGSYVFIVNVDVYAGGDYLDEVFDLIEGYLQRVGMSYTYFNPIDITDLDEVEL